MTEVFAVLAAVIAGLLLIDPFYSGALTTTAFAKGVVLVTGVGSLGFHLLGRAVTAPQRLRAAAADMVADWWPLLLLTGFVFAGSAYALLAAGVKQSFLGLALGLMYLPLVGVAIRSSDQPMRFLKWLAAVHLLLMLSMIGLLLATDHLFHESIYLAVPVGAYFLCAPRLKLWQLLLGLLLIGVCAFSVKNTTFIMILATLCGCLLLGAVRMGRRLDRLTGATTLYFIVIVTVLAAGALALLWVKYKSLLPSGNTEYRLYMYDIAWRRFTESPIWGAAFAGPSVNFFSLYKVNVGAQVLPTHSDILDLLAHGGLIAFSLWAAAMWRILTIGWACLLALSSPDRTGEQRAWRWLFMMVLLQLDAVITYALNPPLINPVAGCWIWGTAGAMWALHRTLVSRTASAAVAGPARAGWHAAAT